MKIELAKNDLRELKTAIADRAKALKHEADRLMKLNREAEAKNLAATAKDLSERLKVVLADALGEAEREPRLV